ncbi:MAG: tRNA (N(6)-L-threonylcarbamoyladenosine(37)-C(2))-methylthiotransferase MtaB [Bacteroidales bacterium]|nr:tRNA (N(6)-L-threonylcarbamoyladenosine(37)-C(2))-methylthiotransferase MtaB [Bacteroidales bacterium]
MDHKRIAFQTFGCKLNFAETSTIARQMKEEGFEVVGHKEEADVYVINSCVVTANAEKKCRAAIRQSKKRNPKSRVAVVGCFSQIMEDELKAMKEVDLVIGNEEKFMLKDYLEHKTYTGACHSFVGNINKSETFQPSWSSGDRTRSFLKIQDGCDYFCSYCTIPLARGRSRSASIADTVRMAEEIGKTPMREIILTGVNIGDFGKPHGESFFGLMQELDNVAGIDRIRISSIEPELLNEKMISFVAESKKFLPHFHIPLQSGSNTILKAMRRKYAREVFAQRVGEIKKYMPVACIAADVIVGFPGETETEFMETYRFLESLDISYMHVFTYSVRKGTKAANTDGKVDAYTKRDRSKRLHELSEKKKSFFYRRNTGKHVSVLFESDNSGGYMHGFSENYLKVKTRFNESLINEIIPLTLGEPTGNNEFVYLPKSSIT